MSELSGIVIGPQRPSGVVIWLHGLGASGDDFAPVVPLMERPDLRFVLPHAPVRPVTINGGFPMRAWYDITRMEPGPGREPEGDIRETASMLTSLVRAEIASGVPASRVVLVGFSQGGAMALHVGLRWPERIGGIAALSTYMVLPESLQAEQTCFEPPLPVFFAHGRHDQVVAMSRGRDALARLETTTTASWNDYPMAHEVCIDEILDLKDFLAQCLPANDSTQGA